MRQLRFLTVLAAVSMALAVTAVFTLTTGADALTSATGTVYHDKNQNGVRDSGEPGIKEVVVQAGDQLTRTDRSGRWSLNVPEGTTIKLRTGWYRTRCNTTTCEAGPGADQDFSVRYQHLRAKAKGQTARYDAGLVPDWPGGYPMPRNPQANEVDISTRVSFMYPTGKAGDSNCYRTSNIRNRACQVGDQVSFLLQIYNEGLRPVIDPGGFIDIPEGTRLVSVGAAFANYPGLGIPAIGPKDSKTSTHAFKITGKLRPATVGLYEVKLIVESGAPITGALQTNGEYPNAVGVRIHSASRDTEAEFCNGPGCRWGVTDRQQWPDNSDTVGFAIVPGGDDPAPRPGVTTTTAAPTTTTTTTTPIVTVPPTTTTQPPTTTTAPTTTTTQPSQRCTVSSILVPSCGVWLGASTPSKNGSYDYAKGLPEYEGVAQNTPDILHFYKSGAARFPTSGEIAQAERSGKQRSLLLYNWKPSKSDTWKQIANGAADSEIATVAASLKKYPHKLFLNIYHEPEDNVNTASNSGMTAKDYAAMYRHVVTELRGHGVTNAVYVWNVMGYYGWRQHLDDLYPGHDYVDWMCYDPYATDNRFPSFVNLVNTKVRPEINWPGSYYWLTNKAPGKPLMMCEWGVDLYSNSNPASVLNVDAGAILSDFPMLKAVVYWNDAGKWNTRIDENTTKGRALGTAYRNFAKQSVFNEMTPDGAP